MTPGRSRLVPRLLPGLLVLSGLCCGKVVPPPSLRAQPVPAAPRPASAAPRTPAAPSSEALAAGASFSLDWSAQTYPWSKGLAITAKGEILVQASRRLTLWSPQDKQLLAEQEVCFTFPEAIGLVAEHSAALVCEQSIELLSLPKLELSRARALPASARVAAFGGGLVAIGFDRGPVRVLATAGWQERATIAVTAEPSALALAADGRYLALGWPTGKVAVHDLGSGEVVELTVASCSACPAPARGISALAFAPRGEQNLLLVSAPPFSAVYPVTAGGGSPPRRLPALTGVALARWLSADEIVTAGSDGILIVSVADGSARSLSARPQQGGAQPQGPPTGLDLSADGRLLCTCERAGRLDCYSRGGSSPPVVQLDLPAPSPAGDEGERLTMAGLVIAQQGRQLTVAALPDTTLPQPGYEVAVLTYTAVRVGPLLRSEWREVARASVRQITPGGEVLLRLLEPEPWAATAPVGKKKNPFPSHTPLKLAWSQGR